MQFEVVSSHINKILCRYRTLHKRSREILKNLKILWSVSIYYLKIPKINVFTFNNEGKMRVYILDESPCMYIYYRRIRFCGGRNIIWSVDYDFLPISGLSVLLYFLYTHEYTITWSFRIYTF